jgi:hypothetical protein
MMNASQVKRFQENAAKHAERLQRKAESEKAAQDTHVNEEKKK